jgi:hypothetical protein
MNQTPIFRRTGLAVFALVTTGLRLSAQAWTDEQLVNAVPGFQNDGVQQQLEQIAALLQHRDEAMPAICARIHGDHREYTAKIERLLAELVDDRWQTREQAENKLIEIGGRARSRIQQAADEGTPDEQRLRCHRILDGLTLRGTQQEERDNRILRGLVATALYLPADPRLVQALRSALNHTDAQVVEGSVRALGVHGGDDEAKLLRQQLDSAPPARRPIVLAALVRIRGPVALGICTELVQQGSLAQTELLAMTCGLRLRSDAQGLLAWLGAHGDAVVAAAASLVMPAGGDKAQAAKFLLADRSQLDAAFLGFLPDGLVLGRPLEHLERVELLFRQCETVDFPAHVPGEAKGIRVFLTQGTLVTGSLVAIGADSVRVQSLLFGQLDLPRAAIQGIAIDPALDRLVGASTEFDRVRLLDNQFVDGKLLRGTAGEVVIATTAGERRLPTAGIAGLLLQRPAAPPVDSTLYTRVDLVSGDRLLGHLAGSTTSHIGLVVPLLGAAAVPLAQVSHLEHGVGGGAQWGFTLISDYSENKIVEVDEKGKVVFEMENVLGPWDAQCLDNGNLLITEFSISRVREVTRKGDTVWQFEDLKSPYAASRLRNGNTLIADTFNGRVIEVTPEGQIAWKYDTEIRPFDCERLQNGNTLIADILKDRVFEVNAKGETVWEVKKMINVHDADRLPNGNTLITLRASSRVIEVDPNGQVVWELRDLVSPSDAERLPNGNTLVAENGQVREFDRHGNQVWRKEMSWAVRVHRY